MTEAATRPAFTPGPWHVEDEGDEYHSHDKSDFDVVAQDAPRSPFIVACTAGRGVESVCLANARLIAAAPELYEALARILFGIDMHPEVVVISGDVLVGARAALAKADGR